MYDLNELDVYQAKLHDIRERLARLEPYCDDDPAIEAEFELLAQSEERLTFELHEYVQAIENLLNADSYGSIH